MKKAGTIATKLLRVIEAATVGQSLCRYFKNPDPIVFYISKYF